ncbi:MAG: gliding motility-associated C-terminal domain-containing protein [Sphingomonadales bacterium]
MKARLFFLFLFAGVCAGDVQAQVCTGSLGDPVVNIDFGTGAAPASFTAPGYQLTTSACPNDGFYSITTSQSNCGRQWHTVSSDHTGGGAFMMVNASQTPGDFFVQTLSNLCPNTTYVFSAWVLNVVNNPALIKPNLMFRIEAADGTVLAQHATGDIEVFSQPTWQQVGFSFTNSISSAPVTLRITNNAPGGQGNDLALDDISFRACGPLVGATAVGLGDTIRVCYPDQRSYSLQAQVSASSSSTAYQWQLSRDTGRTWTDIAGATSLQYARTATEAGLFLYRLGVAPPSSIATPSCRINSNIQWIDVFDLPQSQAGPDMVKFGGRPVRLLATGNQETGTRYAWTPVTGLSDPTILSPMADPAQTTEYTLTVTTRHGCVSTDRVKVEVVASLFVPNAFTPNGDGKNDRWVIPYLNAALGALVTVYDRAGQVVYQSRSNAVAWDGTYKGVPLSTGIYIYQIILPDAAPLKGTVFLLR